MKAIKFTVHAHYHVSCA